MKKIDLDHWGIADNKASISLLHLHAKFDVFKNDEYVFYRVIITDNKMKTLTFNFYTLEDTFYFIEDVVSKSWTLDEVVSRYQELFNIGSFSLPGGMKPPKKDIISLNEDQIDKILGDYFGDGKCYDVSISHEPFINYAGEPEVTYYITEHIKMNDILKDYQYALTIGDIDNAMSAYVEKNGYELVDFKFVGGVHRVGYTFDEDTAYYEGMELRVTKKEKKRILNKM